MGVFSLHSAIISYASLQTNHASTDLIWFKGFIGKHSTCAWFAIRNVLKLRSLLALRGITQDTSCSLCSNGHEEPLHLIVNCPYSATVWEKIAKMFHQRISVAVSIESHIVGQVNSFGSLKHGDVTIDKLCFPALTWNIWRERNWRVFKSKERCWEFISQEIVNQIKTCIVYLNMDLSADIAAAGDLPQRSSIISKFCTPLCSNWDLFFFNQATCSRAVLRGENSNILWYTKVSMYNAYEACIKIMKDAVEIKDSIIILFYNKLIRNAIIERISTKFEAKHRSNMEDLSCQSGANAS